MLFRCSSEVLKVLINSRKTFSTPLHHTVLRSSSQTQWSMDSCLLAPNSDLSFNLMVKEPGFVYWHKVESCFLILTELVYQYGRVIVYTIRCFMDLNPTNGEAVCVWRIIQDNQWCIHSKSRPVSADRRCVSGSRSRGVVCERKTCASTSLCSYEMPGL